MSSLRLDWCDIKAARHAVLTWHYSAALPAGKLVKVGVWEDNAFVGAVLFGLGAGASTDGRQYGLARTHEVTELVRVALAPNHEAPTSRIVAIALRMLNRQSPRLRLVISFADTLQGHHGGIYQAGNWLYAGMTAGDSVFVVRGRRMHPKSVHSRGWVQSARWLRENVDPNATCEKLPGKHRYLYPLDDEMRERIAPLAKPYPKRASEAGDDPARGTAAVQR